MKLLAFCLIVIANVSNNGKASVDNLVPVGSNILLEDTTKSSDNSCDRPCKFNVKPRRCHYQFRVAPTIRDDGKATIAINDIVPGPPIHVCANDIIVVEVQNRVPDQDLAFHWHGVDQKGTPYMDGVPMITQCPIGFMSSYKYAFRASSPGTFFYHADSVSHQSDGVFGALIVNQPQPLEPHSSLYDYDRIMENTLVVSAVFPELLTGNLEDLSHLKPSALSVNGLEDSSKIFVIQAYNYRLRLINAIALECPLAFSIDQHVMTVIASDGKPVKPTSASRVMIYPGERMDVVVRASQEPRGYWIRVRGNGACEGLTSTSMLLYSGFNYTSMLDSEKDNTAHLIESDGAVISGQVLESLSDASHSATVKQVYLGIDKNIVKFREEENDFRYLSDAQPRKPFFPAPLSTKESGVVQINGKSFLYPNAPLLLNPREVLPETMCQVEELEKYQQPQCVQVLEAVDNKVLELALVNEGFGSNDSYTFHLHGFNMQVVATWQNVKNTPITKEDFLQWDKDGKITRNVINPPLKDTIMVPNKGYTIVRIKPDHAGAWMFECRSCGQFSLPTAFVISLPLSLTKSVVDSLPKCGNYKPPDVLLN